jgi:large subunit ribosomal protein L49
MYLNFHQALANDIKTSLFPQGSPEAERLKLDIIRQRHLVLRGGKWKHNVVEWLKQKGF